MDLPLISSFVQSSVDAAVAEYVAPKSISVNLQDLLAGRDYKLDPRARGVVCIRIKREYGFKDGDQAIPHTDMHQIEKELQTAEHEEELVRAESRKAA